MVLALLFMATPLLRVTGITGANRTGFAGRFNGSATPGGQNGFPRFGNGTQGQGNSTNPTTPTNPTTRQFPARTGSVLGLGLLSGITGTIVYGIALLVSLVAAVGMFLTRRWGQVLGIVMGVIYLLLAVVGLIPTILSAVTFARGFNALSLGLSILHLILAIAVIVLALIPAKKILAPAAPAPVSQATPPAASA
jgi:phosphoglycerol transferase MdoB-like AlkP superfamily enzyme